MTLSLDTRQAEAEQHLAELHRQRGAALADGLAFDGTVIADAQQALEAIADASREITRRQHEQAASEELARREQLKAEITASNQRRLDRMAEAEDAARAFAAACKGIIAEAAKIDGAAAKIGSRDRIGTEQVSRLSALLSEALAGVAAAHSRRFGNMELRMLPYRKPSATWGEVERSATLWIEQIGESK